MGIIEQASRCLQCKNAMCSKNCPIATPVPQVVGLFKDGDIKAAGRLLFENNPLSAICSLICPHENNCYGNCVLGRKGEPVAFYQVEQYISGLYLENIAVKKPEKNGFKVGVLGAGPAGIAVSILLAQKGFSVSLIEARDKIGGVLRYGIPEFRLSRALLDEYADLLRQLGVRFRPNTMMGPNITIEDMFIDGYDAVFVSTGVGRPNRLGLLGETLGHVSFAIDYLKTPDSYDLGGRVVVIGAGNVAMDAARTVVRKSHSKVQLIFNRDQDSMTGNRHEIEMAKIDGVEFLYNLETIRIEQDGVICVPVEAEEREDGGKVFTENFSRPQKIPADSVILAIGQGPNAGVLAGHGNLSSTDWGLIEADEEGRTSTSGVFAAGDIVTGPRTAVQAVAMAKRAAAAIEQYCLGK
ncbi:MAG: FAD-dependent oxidoreductase [Eubacteriales bacterium]